MIISEDTSKSYIIDDIIGRHNDIFRIHELAENIKKELKLRKVLFSNKLKLATLDSSQKKMSEYKIESYRIAKSNFIVFFEFYGDLNNFEAYSERVKWHHLEVTISPKNRQIQKLIEEILNES